MSAAKGLRCPECRGVRLHVYSTYKPLPGRVIRYLRCTACGHKTKSEERLLGQSPRVYRR